MLGPIRRAINPVKKLFRKTLLQRDLKRRGPNEPIIKTVSELSALMANKPYLHDLEVPLLQKYARNSSVIVEIGSAFGASAALMLASSNPRAVVHSIDPFVVLGTLHATEKECVKNVRQVLGALGKKKEIERWKLHTDFSYNVVKDWTTPVDLIFIDGDHDYPAVKQDYTEWLPKVKIGGVIIFHDSRKEPGTPPNTFNRGWSGPTILAEELRKDTRVKLIEEAFSMTAWKKIAA